MTKVNHESAKSLAEGIVVKKMPFGTEDARTLARAYLAVMKEVDEVNRRLTNYTSQETEEAVRQRDDARIRLEAAERLIGDTQDFLKHLIHGDSQYRFGNLVMANGMQHARELDQHIKKEIAAWRSQP